MVLGSRTAFLPPPGAFAAGVFQEGTQSRAASGSLRPELIVANFLDAHLAQGSSSSGGSPLTQALRTGAVDTLAAAYRNLSRNQKNTLDSMISRSTINGLLNLSQESHWGIFFRDWNRLGDALMQSGRLESAQLAFTSATDLLSDDFAGALPQRESLRARAQGRLDTMAGQGSLGTRFEFNAQHFFRDVSDPISLASMAAAGLTFGVTRLGALSSLGRLRNATWWTRGLGAHGLAWTAGLGAEVTAFVGVGRGLRTLTGQTMDWSAESLQREFLGTTMMLGFLKSFGAASRFAMGRQALVHSRFFTPQGSWLQRTPYQVLPQLAMLGGIMTAHGIEEHLGWRPQSDGSSFLFDSLVTLLHFNVAGKILEGALGAPYQGLQRDLHTRVELLQRDMLRSLRLPPGGFGHQLSPAFAALSSGNRARPRRVSPLEELSSLMSASEGDSGGKGSKPEGALPQAPTLDFPLDQNGSVNGVRPETRMGRPVQPERPYETPTEAAPPSEAELASQPKRSPSSEPPSLESIQYELKSGMILGNGRYEVIDILGEGGMGKVWLLTDRSLSRYSVLKIPHRQLRETYLPRFEMEYKMQAHLPRNWRVEIYEILEVTKGLRVPVMEYVPGNDLIDHILDVQGDFRSSLNDFPLERRLEMFAQVCEAMVETHEMGIVHRDLKPENIRIPEEGGVRILDYGVAKLARDLDDDVGVSSMPPEFLTDSRINPTQQGMMKGTPGYIAPESANTAYNPPPDPRLGDVFSLGVVLWELTTGMRPYDRYDKVNRAEAGVRLRYNPDVGESAFLPQIRIVNGEIPKFSDVLPGKLNPLLLEIERIARRAMTPDIAQRYQSVQELRQAILMARPRVNFADLQATHIDISQREENLRQRSRLLAQQSPRDPFQSQRARQLEDELRYLRRSWLRESENIVTDIMRITGNQVFPEAQRMIADISWEQLVEGGSRLYPAERRTLLQRIAQNDVDALGRQGGFMRRAIQDAVPVRVEFSVLNRLGRRPVKVKLDIQSLIPENDVSGLETGNFQAGATVISRELLGENGNVLNLNSGYYVAKVEAAGFAPMEVPVWFRLDDVRTSLESRRPLQLNLQLVPEDLVPQDMRVVHATKGTIGHNFYFDGDTTAALSFPFQSIELPTIAMSKYPVTVRAYYEFIRDLVARNNRDNADDSAAFKENYQEIRAYLPWTSFPVQARRGKIKAIMQAFTGGREGAYYWRLGLKRQGGMFSRRVAFLEDPTLHPDPFGDPILWDHPMSAITVEAGEAYAKWRSDREGVPFRIVTAEEKEVVARNSFDWRYPWGNGALMETYVVAANSFVELTDSRLVPVGTHPLPNSYRDVSLYGIYDLLGNVREFTSTPGAPEHIVLSGGSIRDLLGVNYSPSSRNQWTRRAPDDASGGIRLVIDLSKMGINSP